MNTDWGRALLGGGVAALVAALLTPFVRWVALHTGTVDNADSRKIHAGAIPRLGGIGIVAGYVCAAWAVLAAGGLELSPSNAYRLLGFGLGGAVIVIVGLLDDIRGMRAWWKLGAQIAAALIAWSAGVRINPTIDIPGMGVIDFGMAFSLVATLVWILAITNAINLIDGLDGLAGGVAFFAATTNLIVAVVANDPVATTFNAALAGAVLGFLFYNFNPAKIFMGDVGSLFLGFALSAGALLTSRQKESTLASLLVPIIALGLPLTDTLVAMARRFVARRPIFSADRLHLHHRLLDLGLTHRRAVLVLYGTSVLLCGAAVAATFGKDWSVGAALLGAVVVLGSIVRFAGSFQVALKQRRRKEYLYTPATMAARRAIRLLDVSGTETKDELLQAFLDGLEPEHFPEIALTSSEVAHPGIRGSDAQNNQGRRLRRGSQSPGGRSERRLCPCHFQLDRPWEDGLDQLTIYCAVESSSAPPQLEILLRLLVDIVDDRARALDGLPAAESLHPPEMRSAPHASSGPLSEPDPGSEPPNDRRSLSAPPAPALD